MERLELLKQLAFGSQVAEEEINELGRYFVETDEWARIARGEVDIIRGEKGSGKSAIYFLLNSKEGELFDKGILIVSGENPRGQTVFRDLVAAPPTTEHEFKGLWKLYIAALIAKQMREFDVRNDAAARAYYVLEDIGLIEKEISLSRLLHSAREYLSRLIKAESYEGGVALDPNSGLPSGVTFKVTLKEPTHEQRKGGALSIDDVFALLNEALKESKFKVWILLDRLDVAFTESHDLEANALRALMRVYADLRALEHISLKIFLREDIWKRIMVEGFREASHITRYVVLDWNPQSLLNLTMRRMLSNSVLLDEFGIDSTAVLSDFKRQEDLFYRLFPDQVEQGERKSETFKWLVSRCADGTRKTAPRELIQLLNCIKKEEIRRLEQGQPVPQGGKIFDRSVFKSALPEVSNARLRQYLYAEYPSYRPYVEKLEGQKSEQTQETLAKLWNVSQPEAKQRAMELVELGFFEAREKNGEITYWVPFLYRDALSLVQGRAEED